MKTIPELIRDHAFKLEDARREMEQTHRLHPNSKLLFQLVRSDSPAYEMVREYAEEPNGVVTISFRNPEDWIHEAGFEELAEDYRDSAGGVTFLLVATGDGLFWTRFTPGEPWTSQFEKQMAEDGE